MVQLDSHSSSLFSPDLEILSPVEILRQFDQVNVAAPMVRYSKLPFRQLVSLYDCHITHTPMMLAQEFSRSAIARDSDFSTNSLERGIFSMPSNSSPSVNVIPNPFESSRSSSDADDSSDSREALAANEKIRNKQRRIKGALIVQFAANDAVQLADAAELVKPWVDGIDLNCGCPQKWAYNEGIGCALLRKPELVRDLVRGTKQRVGWDFPVSVKIRVDDDLTLTNELVQTAIHAGASYITIHGRTRHQSSTAHPVNLASIKFAVDCAKGEVPCVANGDVFTLEEAKQTRRETGAGGVMSARGLLANPALFTGYDKTPLEAVSQFIRISTSHSLLFPLFHHHLSYMIESHLTTKKERSYFNSLSSHAGVIDYCEEVLGCQL